MPVLIDQLDVVPAEAPPKRGAEGEQAASAPEAAKPNEYDIEKMMARHMERCERVWAH